MLKSWAKRIRSLHQKKYRYEEQLFLVEGAKSVAELLGADMETVALFHTDEFVATYPRAMTVAQKKVAHIESVKQADLESAGTLQTNDGALAVVRMLPNKPVALQQGYALALADIRDPGNLGTIIRIADWYGIRQLVCSQTTVDWYNPKVIAASMGSFLRVKAYYCDLEHYLSTAKAEVYGAFLDGESVHEAAFAPAGIVVMGNEANGIPPEIERLVTRRITIPRFGGAESLNAAIATAVICDNLRRIVSS